MLDTKLRKYSIWLKTLCFTVFILASVLLAAIVVNTREELQDLGHFKVFEIIRGDYSETDNFFAGMDDANELIIDIYEYSIQGYPYEKYSDEFGYEVNVEVVALFNEKTNNQYADEVDLNYGNPVENASAECIVAWEAFLVDYEEEVTQITETAIEESAKEYEEQLKTNLEKYDGGLVYFFDATATTNTDCSSYYEFEEEYFTLSNGKRNLSFTGNAEYVWAFTEDYMMTNFIVPFEEATEVCKDAVVTTLPLLIVISICTAYLIYATGRRNPEKMKLSVIDKIYVELSIVLMVVTALPFALQLKYMPSQQYFSFVIIGIEVAIILMLFLSLVRHIKNKTFFKHTMTYKIVSNTKTMTYLLMPVLIIGCFGMVTLLLFRIRHSAIRYEFIIMLLALACFTFCSIIAYRLIRNTQAFDKISKGTARIKSGNYDEKIVVAFPEDYKKMADDLNDISVGLSEEVERRIKSERLKSDLITNVSHDLKTPITSFIAYLELLKKKNIEDEEVQRYIEVLDQKSTRLKTLVDDLVDSAKASSGNVPVNLEKVDIHFLLEQILSEFEAEIVDSSLDFKVDFSEVELFAYADGKHMWRVVNNMISNVLKYSLKGSRVYINTFENDDNCFIELKNISSSELNISSDELMERFVRGDLARTSSGSGLGLDIAKSLMKAQNGEISISINGDLFIATVRIGKFNK